MAYSIVIFDYNGTLCNAEEASLANEDSVLYAGVLDTLKQLDEQGVMMGIATHMSAPGLRMDLKRLGIDHLFVATRCIGQCQPKPHPQMIEEILDAAGGLPANKALMVGDTTADIQMGQHAGCDTVAVGYGLCPLASLREASPTYTIERFDQLLEIVST